jgi:GNAT superfamily N-acetyltransferase
MPIGGAGSEEAPQVSRGTREQELTVRPYRDEDEAPVLELLRLALGEGSVGARPPEFFRWKHLSSPFGESLMLLAEADGRIVGFRAYMPWLLRAGDRILRARKTVDLATHPDHRRKGISLRLRREAHAMLRSGDTELTFGSPNVTAKRVSRKGGTRFATRFPVSFRVRRPIMVAGASRALRGRRDSLELGPPVEVEAETAAEALSDGEEVSTLLDEESTSDRRLTTARDLAYLRWRYGSAPHLDYRAIRELRGGRLAGLAIFRVHRTTPPLKATVAEVIVRPGDSRTARRLLRAVVAAAPGADYFVCHFPTRSPQARGAWRAGFVRSPRGVMLMSDALRDDVSPKPTDAHNWALSLGDLEVL